MEFSEKRHNSLTELQDSYLDSRMNAWKADGLIENLEEFKENIENLEDLIREFKRLYR